MFSVENIYYVLYCNLFKKINVNVEYFLKFGSTDLNDLVSNFTKEEQINNRTYALFYDQEPVQTEVLDARFNKTIKPGCSPDKLILVTSEHSELVKQYCKQNNMDHLYYFFHGFACLHWFRDAAYFSKNKPDFNNKFLSFNRLCIDDRNYRLLFVSELIKRDILQKGKVSLQLIRNNINVVKQEVFSSNSKLSKRAKMDILKTLQKKKNNFEVDKQNVVGSASADLGYIEYKTLQNSFLHVVSETVFYHKKLHLTEKIFKPIVSQRPFILLGAYKNLEYLKSYGFKTFDKWIDESYDNEPDNEKRLMMVCDEVEKIANLEEEKIEVMYWDMQKVLAHNYNHFYTDFKQIIVNELVDNFEGYLRWHNHDRLYIDSYDIDNLNLSEVKRLLAQ